MKIDDKYNMKYLFGKDRSLNNFWKSENKKALIRKNQGFYYM
jgi:hypothetical protein